MTTSSVTVLLLLFWHVEGLSIVPKLDLSDGIEQERQEEIRAVLEVNLVHPDPKPTPNRFLICTLDGKCKVRAVEDDKEAYDPAIVSDFDVDAEEDDGGKDGDDDCKNKKKKTPAKVPVFVAHDGAAPDILPLGPAHHPRRGLPVYYGLKLEPQFRRPDRVVKYVPLHPPRMVIAPYGGASWTTVDDKVDLDDGKVSSADDVKVVSKIGDELLASAE